MNGARSDEKALAELEVARRRAGLDERGALPVLADRLVILIGARNRERDRRRGGVRPQAQVDPQHVAFARSLLHETRQRSRQAREHRPRLRSRRNRGGRRVVEHDQVDVARIVELARAMLAERQHDHAGAILTSGASGSSAKSPARACLRRRKARAARTAASAKRVNASVASTTSQTPPMSASAIKSADSRLARRSARHELRLVLVAP